MKAKYLLAGLFLALFPAPMYPQSGGVVNETDILYYFASIPALASAVVILTQAVKKLVTFAGDSAQYVSWGVSLLLGAAGYIFNWGIFESVSWYVGLIYAFAAALIANGLFDWEIVKSVLKALKLYEDEPMY
ncbi:MAG TPA: hypothetical protein VHO28_05420 [Ignavibacteriales bacterium]|nr:hypothetical protein [Ignavibacteriales bacterium]